MVRENDKNGRVFDVSVELKDNAMLKVRPDLFDEWDFVKNDELGLDIYKVSFGSNKNAFWNCSFDKTHKWESNINNRSKGNGCPYCANKKVLKGFNDMWTTNPELASLLANPEDGYKYTCVSGVYVDWKCSHCENLIENKQISKINYNNFYCPICSDDKSYPERFLLALLNEINIQYVNEIQFNWSDNKRYDFYIPSLNMIIEAHGRQHYVESHLSFGSRSLKEEQENDKYKRELAKEHGVQKYIELDCMKSEFKYIKESIFKSELANIFDLTNIQWDKFNAVESRYIEILKLWNQGLTLKEISQVTGITRDTISKKLRNFEEVGMCVYNPMRAHSKQRKIRNDIVIYQFDKDMNVIKKWDSLLAINKELGHTINNIKRCCKGGRLTAYGFIWKYERDMKQI